MYKCVLTNYTQNHKNNSDLHADPPNVDFSKNFAKKRIFIDRVSHNQNETCDKFPGIKDKRAEIMSICYDSCT
jgi:hypothetical protein